MRNFTTELFRSKSYRILIICLTFLSIGTTLNAKWELVKSLPSAYSLYMTKQGTMLMCDLNASNGGIIRSEDQGKTWTKCSCANYSYAYFTEIGDYLFAGGYNCRMARSADDGKTWEIIRYDGVIEDLFNPGDAERSGSNLSTVYFKDRIYTADMGTGCVLYSEDFGEKWELTDRKSMATTGDQDFIYQLQVFNDRLYAMGAYLVYRLDETNDTWQVMRNSNFMGTSTVLNGKFIAAHGGQNGAEDAKCIEFSEDGETWNDFPRPAEIVDNAVRGLDTDGKGLFVASQSCGVYYTEDEGQTFVPLNDGIPSISVVGFTLLHIPMQFVFTEEWVYLAFFNFDDPTSGLYKISREELKTSIEEVQSGNKVNIYTSEDNTRLCLSSGEFSDDMKIQIIDTYGTTRYEGSQTREVNISTFEPGIYICTVYSKGIKHVSKFIKN